MTDENKNSTPAEPVEVAPDATKAEPPVEVAPDATKAAPPVEEVNGGPEEPIENGGGK